MNYTISEIGLKVKSAAPTAKAVSIIRKYRDSSMAEIISDIKDGNYILKSTVISHPGVRMIRKCYDELIKSGIEAELYERDQLITRELVSNLIKSHRQTDREVAMQVEKEATEQEPAE